MELLKASLVPKIQQAFFYGGNRGSEAREAHYGQTESGEIKKTHHCSAMVRYLIASPVQSINSWRLLC